MSVLIVIFMTLLSNGTPDPTGPFVIQTSPPVPMEVCQESIQMLFQQKRAPNVGIVAGCVTETEPA